MSEKRIVRAAAVQMAPDLESGEGTLGRVLAAIAAAAPGRPITRPSRSMA
jgi:aliphatic nitrilase